MFKKVLSILLVGMMLFSSMIVSKAEIASLQPSETVTDFAQKNIGFLLNNLKSDPEAFGMTGIDFDNLTLSKPIIPYDADNNYATIKDLVYYPVLENNKIVAIYSVTKSKNGTLTATLGRDFADEINNFISSNNEKFSLVISSDGLHIINNLETAKLEHNNKHKNGHLKIDIKNAPKEIMTSEIKSDYKANIDSSTKGAMLRGTLPDKYTIHVPVVRQYNDNVCWAACAASVGQYWTNIRKTARQVCDILGISYSRGGTLSNTEDALEDIYDINAGVNKRSHYEGQEVSEVIHDEGKPIIAGFKGDGKLGHMVVVCGYRIYSSGKTLTIMDPNYSYYRTSTYNDDEGDYTIVVDGHVFEWLGQCYIK
ncbi:papain-like cysteine protease family protein [Maledivibacter halophilus]|uniref:Papain-like cysteine protease AvrRpt2 n=1 Tax=Maledivibacter halophilus TaxID=36842 RepID=A0A1T5MLJ8_9FIRM|nr:papain-like cysteine protease family protein [Maledivibacter halophilus]SKC89095.1 Papain-like cysteine protease AvrRpt2 [Maledivibacter halophilus]